MKNKVKIVFILFLLFFVSILMFSCINKENKKLEENNNLQLNKIYNTFFENKNEITNMMFSSYGKNNQEITHYYNFINEKLDNDEQKIFDDYINYLFLNDETKEFYTNLKKKYLINSIITNKNLNNILIHRINIAKKDGKIYFYKTTFTLNNNLFDEFNKNKNSYKKLNSFIDSIKEKNENEISFTTYLNFYKSTYFRVLYKTYYDVRLIKNLITNKDNFKNTKTKKYFNKKDDLNVLDITIKSKYGKTGKIYNFKSIQNGLYLKEVDKFSKIKKENIYIFKVNYEK